MKKPKKSPVVVFITVILILVVTLVACAAASASPTPPSPAPASTVQTANHNNSPDATTSSTHRTITDYVLVFSYDDDLNKLSALVDDYIAAGWQPYGCFAAGYGYTPSTQAMVRYEN